MRFIFDSDVDDEDFIEIILSDDEIEKIREDGVNKDFRAAFYGRNLNVFIRKELMQIAE